MSLKIRRGLEADRTGFTPDEGELIYVTDTQLVYVGDGSTAGGILVTGSGSGGSGLPIATGGGTADAITATYSPALTLTDKMICAVVLSGANTITNPTFAPNGLTAHTITKNGGSALVVGDLPGALAVVILEYNLANTRWEIVGIQGDTLLTEGALINSATSKATPVDADYVGLMDSAASNILKKLSWANIKATLITTWKDVSGGFVGLTLLKINFKNTADTFTSFLVNANTAARTYTFPDKTGTAALLDDAMTIHSLFNVTSTLPNTGSTTENIIYNVSPNLNGVFSANDTWILDFMVQASNNANNKDIRFYISDAQASLSNQVLIGRMTVTTSAATNQSGTKAVWFRGAVNSQLVTQAANGGFSQVAQVSTTINFATDKYLVITAQCANAADTLSLLQGWSRIHRP